MSLTPECPDEKTIERLIDGNVSPEQEEQLAAHLNECDACRDRLDRLSSIDSIVEPGTAPVETGTIVSTGSDTFAEKLNEIRSARPAGSSALMSGYADVLPWMEESAEGIGIIGDFELTHFIGRGGMGLVFKARDRKLQRPVAVKLMSPGLLADPQASERFLREARSAAGINHINVVTVHSVDQIRGLPYLVMEFVSGMSLEEHVRKVGAVPAGEILKVARQTAQGLAAAHDNGITHRDIKPSNLMLDRKSRKIKIADFGLASTLNETSLTRSGTMVGTPDFASPEQVNARPVDARSDLFSLGSVLYHLCTGSLPFQSESLVGTFDAIRSRRLARADQVNDQVPTFLANIIERLMEKEPANRFQSARELLGAIEGAGNQPLSRLSLQIDEREKPARNSGHPQPRLALALGVVAFACLSVLALVLMDPFGIRDSGSSGSGLAEHVGSNDGDDVNNTGEPDEDEDGDFDHELHGDFDAPLIFVNDPVELREALERPGDVAIELAPGEVFEIERTILADERVIRLTGDIEDRPVIKSSSVGARNLMEAVSGGSLILHGIAIQDDRELMSAFPLVKSEGSTLEILDCVISSESREVCIFSEDSTLTIDSSTLVVQQTALSLHSVRDNVIEIIDSAIVSSAPITVEESRNLELAINGSCFVGWTIVEFESQGLEDVSVEINAHDSIFVAVEAFIGLRVEFRLEPSEFLEQFDGRFVWGSSACEIPSNLCIFYSEEGEDEDEEQVITWDQAGIAIDSETELLDEEDGAVIEELIEQYSGDGIQSVEQVRRIIEDR
ncbi:MAG: protein kinase [Planctomycetota bacterium]